MRLQSPSGGTVDATGDEAQRLIACGFVSVPVELDIEPPVEEPKPKPKPKAAPRRRKSTNK